MGHSVQSVTGSYACGPKKRSCESNPVSLLYDLRGNRKYLTVSERAAFSKAAEEMPPEVRTCCLMLAYTGMRVSELLALTPRRFNLAARHAIVENLKKRRRGIYFVRDQ